MSEQTKNPMHNYRLMVLVNTIVMNADNQRPCLVELKVMENYDFQKALKERLKMVERFYPLDGFKTPEELRRLINTFRDISMREDESVLFIPNIDHVSVMVSSEEIFRILYSLINHHKDYIIKGNVKFIATCKKSSKIPKNLLDCFTIDNDSCIL